MAVKAIRRWTSFKDWAALDVVLNMEQVCGILRISRPTAIKLLQSGELPGVKVCGTWRVDRDALRAYLQGGGKEAAG